MLVLETVLYPVKRRSIENYNLRYVEFLGDGDSKSHNLLVSESVYGDIEVTKLECVGHVQKCMGSRLRPLKKRTGQACLEDGKGIAGRGRKTTSHAHFNQSQPESSTTKLICLSFG